jgi:hypothetical protein
MYRMRTWGSVLVLGALLVAGGCGSPRQKEPAKSPAATQEKAAESDKASTEAASAPAAEETPEGLKELSAEDRAAAEKQRICPVTGELLGTMGKPFKITVQDQTVFLCCPSCEEQLRKTPEKYLAKLKK